VLEEALVVAQMIGVDVEEVANEGQSFRTWRISDSTAVYRDRYGSLAGANILECAQSLLAISERYSCSIRQ